MNGLLVLRIIDDIVYAGSGEKAAPLILDCLFGQKQNSLIGIPILIEVSILFVLE